jgi:hypothetical protein
VATPLITLADHVIVFTGPLSEVRRTAASKAIAAGAVVHEDVTATTTVVVQGALSPNWKYGDHGVKLHRAAELRKRGQGIYVVTENEFYDLLAGRGLDAGTSQAASEGLIDPQCVAFRPTATERHPQIVDPADGDIPLHRIDLDDLERRTKEHNALVAGVREAILKRGLKPASPLSSECLFDIGWTGPPAGRRIRPPLPPLHLVEVKTTLPKSERQQLRLGLGQVLGYRQWEQAVDPRRSIHAHLVLSRKPHNDLEYLVNACHAADVNVVYGNELQRLFDD